MNVSYFQTYIQGILTRLPLWHWAAIGVSSLALTAILWARKKESVYGATMLGCVVFCGLFLLDVAVVSRWCGLMPHGSGIDIKLSFSRLFHPTIYTRAELISNIVVFIPFGFFLSVFLASTKRFSIGRQIGLVTLATFALSLLIECLQLILHVGFFEVTDLVLNTVGGLIGATTAAIGRLIIRNATSTETH